MRGSFNEIAINGKIYQIANLIAQLSKTSAWKVFPS